METILPDRDLAAIEAVVFDAYGTLFDVVSVADGVRAAVGTDGDRADRVIELWRRKQLEYSWVRALVDWE